MTQLLFDPLQCGNCLHMATFRFHPPKKFSRDRQKSHWRVWVGGGGGSDPKAFVYCLATRVPQVKYVWSAEHTEQIAAGQVASQGG